MKDTKKKLEALSKELGLKTGADIQRGETARPTPAAAQDEPPQDPSSHEQTGQNRALLGGLGERLGLMTGAQWQRDKKALEEQRAAGDFEVGKVLDGEIVGDEADGFFLLRQDFPLDHAQGAIPLSSALDSVSAHIAFSAADPELADFDPRTAVFVDTETTGLAGGTGTVAFLVGAGYFIEDAFRLEQCFMRDYDDEEPMLEYLAQRFAESETVVGYNSKSFDIPLLRTRFIQNRLPCRLDAMPHYDLVHAARRFWKRRLADCTLGTIEREILGIRRHGDVPSHLIPEMWFDYLHSRDARPLEGVFYHHRMDILSLAALTGWLSQCLEAPAGAGFEHHEDRLSLVRQHYRQKNYPEVIRLSTAYLENDERSALRRECLEMLATAHKRLGAFDTMQATFELLLDEFPSDPNAHLELAKHHEHRTRNLPQAEAHTRHAHRTPNTLTETQALERRLARIREKLEKGRLDSAGGTIDG